MTTPFPIAITDIRHLLPRRAWQIGTRAATTSITWHWNGPPVASARQQGGGLITQLIADATWQMRAGWGGSKEGAPHLMYHLVIAADGEVYQTADLNEQLWHCAHQDGNTRGLAIHFPLGVGQAPSTIQLERGLELTDTLSRQYRIPLSRILGHSEWKQATQCPGPFLLNHITTYRAGMKPIVIPTIVPTGVRRFQITVPTANIRQAPRSRWPNGVQVPIAGRLKQGAIIYVDVVKGDGEAIDGNRNWVHLANVPNEQADLGFVSETLGAWL